MRRFRNILLVSSGQSHERPALIRALSLAKQNQAAVTLAGVVPWLEGIEVDGTRNTELSSLISEELYEALNRQFAEFVESPKSIIRILSGTPFLSIIRTVLSEGYDLVITTGTKDAGWRQPLVGSAEMHLMRKCPCPVWVIKPDAGDRFSRIVAAVDPNPHEEENRALSRKILELASSLARTEKADLEIVHAWSVLGESTLRRRLSAHKFDEILAGIGASHRRWLEELVAEANLGEVKCGIHLAKGSPADVISEFATAQKADLIVMGTVGRTGISGFLIGNTAENVLNCVNCSVLAAKPDGFISPVTLPA